MKIHISNINKKFADFIALKNINLTIEEGELVALLGPSGSGKTTLLRIIAGLDVPDSGQIILDGEDVSQKNPKDRHVGFVFQHYALFRHMTVFENVAFGLRIRPRKIRPSKAEIRETVFTLLKLVQLEHFANRYPSQLSGGQRQRVALARVLAIKPKILLLDEPFGALDAKVRKELRRWLRRLHDEIHVTSVFVTHDQEEALEVANRLVIMNEGCIEQVGSPEEVYHQPVNPFVFNFIGDVNIFHGRVNNGTYHFVPRNMEDSLSTDISKTKMFVRPHLMDLSHEPAGNNCFKGKIIHINPAGPFVKIELKSEWGDSFQVNLQQEQYKALNLRTNMKIYVIPKEMFTFS